MSDNWTPTTDHLFHMADLGTIEVIGFVSAGDACPACFTPENKIGWKFRTAQRGWEVFQCPGCRQNVAVGK